jgi:hypothetical protein
MLVDDFKEKADLTLEDLKGSGSQLTYKFSMEKDYVYITFDNKYINLSIEIETNCKKIEDFNFCYNELKKIIDLRYHNSFKECDK